jgi:pimeloyl-ACP methyl ester carboxylesterase
VSTPRHLDLPPGVQTAELVTGRGRFAALRSTPADQAVGEVLLLPGFTGSKEDFLSILGPIASGGYAVVAVDQRGQHESDGPDDIEAYGLATYAADAVAMAERISTRPVHLVGHSFGGLVARTAAIRHPASFASVTLLGSGAGAVPDAVAEPLRLFADVLAGHGPHVAWEAKKVYDSQREGATPVPAHVSDFLDRRFHATNVSSLLAMAKDLLTAEDRVDELAAAGVPVEVVWGADDDLWPADHQRALAARLRTPGVEVADAGHSPNVDQPERLAAALVAHWNAVTQRQEPA